MRFGLRISGSNLAPRLLALVLGGSALAEESPVLSEKAMAGAIDYFGVVTGRPLSDADGAWLRRRWAEQHAKTPHEAAAQLDRFLVQLELHRRDADPIALANSRSELIDGVYCAAERTGDPDVHRLREILAPNELVSAADCAFGMVVTRFDLDGIAASHGLLASIAGLNVDVEKNLASVAAFVEAEFDKSEPESKALMADGELRHALAERFWCRLDGDPRKAELTPALRDQAIEDLPGAARNLETMALQQLASVDYVAEAKGFRLTSADLDDYLKIVELIAGEPLSLRDRVWVREAAVEEFLDDPAKVSDWFASYARANRDHLIEDDPERRTAMVASWAAGAYCHLANAQDPAAARTLAAIFRANPVVSSDCEAKTLERRDDAVVAEAGGLALTEADLKTTKTWLAFVLGRRAIKEEAAFDRAYVTRKFEQDPAEMTGVLRNMRAILAKQERQELAFLWEKERRKRAAYFYCHFKYSDDEKEDAYVDMYAKKDEILYEDCDNNVISTREDVDAVIGSIDFLASLAGLPPLTVDERAELRRAWAGADMSYGEINRIALSEWWSMIDLPAKKEALARLRSSGFTHARDVDAAIVEWLNHAKLNAVMLDAKREQCAMMAVMSRGYASLYAAKSGPGMLSPYGVLGYELTHLIPMNNAFGAFCS